MPKINREEYEVLKEAQEEGYKWIARNYNGALIIYTSKPMKNPNLYWDGFGKRMDDRLFQFIQWEDEDSYNIQELIEEYLYDNQPKLFIDGQEQSFEFIEESEETEVKKNIEWLKSAIQQNLDFYNDNDEEWQMAKVRAYAKSLDLINQLDEPEVLSSDWISENVEYAYFDMLDGSGRLSSATGIIKPEKLQNLLVPKQEEVDRAYKDGYEKGRELGFYKGYREGLANKGGEPETVADVVTTFWKSYERLKEVMNMEVEELEE